jgi:hypothetical protein
MDSETPREFYERRVTEIMKSYLKNIKECDQDPWKKKPWINSTELGQENKGEPLGQNDDVHNIFEPR